MGGVTGLNFAGAMTQVMQQIAPATQPQEVSTLIKHGLGHITQPHYVKGLEKVGIDIKKYAPEGKFYGEGGVQGLLDLAREMKAKGLLDPFKLGAAGFREQYTQNFWRQLMLNTDDIEKQMGAAKEAYKTGQIDKDREEIKKSNFGKVKGLQIETDKAQVGDTATGGAGFLASMAEHAADHKGQYVGAGVSALLLGRYAYNRYRNRGAGGGVAGLPGAPGGTQQVFVTNWPGGMLSPGEVLNQKRGNLPGGSAPDSGAGGKTGKLAKAGSALGAIGAGVSGWELGYNVIGPVINDGVNSLVSALSGKENSLGGMVYDLLHREKEPTKVEVAVKVENGNITAQVNEANERSARRN